MTTLKPIKLSDKVVVTDPCYTRDTWCMGFLENVKPGNFTPTLEYEDQEERVRELMIVHESESYISPARWEKQDFEVGVDSGQAGIFCDSLYPQGETGDYGDKTTFYGACCNATLGEGYEGIQEWARKGGKGPRPEWNQGDTVFGKGVVSCSGYGDGGYECFVARDSNGQIIAIKIEFIPEDVEDDYEEEEEMDEE